MKEKLRKTVTATVLLPIFLACPFGGAQQKRSLPPVSALIERFDKNGDGHLAKSEVAGTSLSRVFASWDADKDNKVSKEEIEAFRRKRFPSKGENNISAPPRLTIPEVDDLVRLRSGERPSREQMKNSAFILATEKHQVEGEAYIILTDHTSPGYLASLQALAKHHNGSILQTDDLALLYKNEGEVKRIRGSLRDSKARFLAIAPRMDTFRENMLLGLLELTSTLDGDYQLDVYPGFLLASDEDKFKQLIDRSIKQQPQTRETFQPFAISQVPSVQELRSLQKAGILRKMFQADGYTTPTLAIYSSKAKTAPKLPGEKFWRHDIQSRRDFLANFPDPAIDKEFNRTSLLVMHGHGIPGMSCGVDVKLFQNGNAPEVLFCGSCFSAAPKKSDFPAMNQAPGGYGVEDRDAFTVQAIDHGSTVAFGHMRLSQGFPHLFPTLETLLEGRTVGEAYQELLNGLITTKGFKEGQFTVAESKNNKTGRQPSQNILLYIMIGDPALRPFRLD